MFDAESATGLSSIMEMLDTSSEESRVHADTAPVKSRDPAISDVFSFAHKGTHNFCDGPPYLRCNAPHGEWTSNMAKALSNNDEASSPCEATSNAFPGSPARLKQ